MAGPLQGLLGQLVTEGMTKAQKEAYERAARLQALRGPAEFTRDGTLSTTLEEDFAFLMDPRARQPGGGPPVPPRAPITSGPLTPQEMADFESRSLAGSRSRGAGGGQTLTPQEMADFESQSLNSQWRGAPPASAAPTPTPTPGPNTLVPNRGSQFVGPRTAGGLISEVAGETPEQLARRTEVEALYLKNKPYDSLKGAAGATAAGVGIGAGLLGIDSMGPRADLSSPVPGEEQPLHSPVPVDLSTPEGLRAEITRKKDQLSRDTGKSIKDLEKQTVDAIASTIPEEQKPDFMKTIEGLDLLNFSMSILANNNGEMNAGQVIGLAFQAALKQKEGRDQLKVENKIKDRAATADEERAAAATTGAEAAASNAETNATYTPVGLKIDQQNADAATMRAQADMVAAAQGTTGSLSAAKMLVGGPMNRSQLGEAQQYVSEVLGPDYTLKTDPKKSGRVGDMALVEATAQAIAAERNYRAVNRIPQPFTRDDAIAIARRVAEPVLAAGVKTAGWGETLVEPSMLNPGGYTPANPGPRVSQPTTGGLSSQEAQEREMLRRQLAGQQ